MKIALVALGTRGDVQPMIAFGKGLADAGFDVRIASHEPFRSLVTSLGLPFTPTRLDTRALLSEGEGQKWVESGQHPVKAILHFRRALLPRLPELFQELREATADADVIGGMAPGVLESTLADAAGARYLGVSVMPMTRTRAFPNPNVAPFSTLPGLLNALTYDVAGQVFWQLFRSPLQGLRRSAGLAPLSFLGTDPHNKSTPSLLLNSFSSRIVPRPTDWSELVQTPGYLRVDDENDTGDQTALEAFLRSGPPPIFVGFGSMTPRDASRLTDVVLQALRLRGRRGVLMKGWGGLDAATGKMDDDMFIVDRVSHSWLFPRMAAAVHHGGSGTTGTAVMAGIPSVIVPFLSDQRFWGGRIARLGLGPDPMPYQTMTAEQLAAALDLATSEPVRARAASLGREVAAETPIKTAVDLFTRYYVD